MVNLYYLNAYKPLSQLEFDHHLKGFPIQIASKIRSFRRWQDAHTALFGKLLLLKGLKDLSLNYSLTDLKYSEYNRPYFNCTNIDFNISHSGSSVVCAISDEGTVGIDIEEIIPVELYNFQQQFQRSEWVSIITSKYVLDSFFTYWTQKEAAIKADGRGLLIPLDQVCVQDGGVRIGTRFYKSYEVSLMSNVKCYLVGEKIINSIKIYSVNYQNGLF